MNNKCNPPHTSISPDNSPSAAKEESIEPSIVAAAQTSFASPRRIFLALGRLRVFNALRHREYRLIWYGQIFASMATWMDQVARGWLLYELTNSTLQLGLVRGVQAIPLLLLSPLAGSTADRYSRKMQVLVAQIVDGLLYVAVALLIFGGKIEPWHVYFTAIGMSVVQAFQQPSRAAMIGDAVPAKDLTNAIGLNSIIFNVSRSAGPAFAGSLIAVVGTGGAYTAQAVCYFLATIWTVQLQAGQKTSSNTPGIHRHEPFRKSIIEGWKFSWRNDAVRASLLIVACSSIFIIPFMTLLPVFARDVLHVGATGQGLLLSAMGIGALFSSFLIASFGDRVPRISVMLAGVALYGLLIAAFAVCPWFKLSVILMGLVGIVHVTSHALAQTVIQTYSPNEFRGRTMALYHMTHVILLAGGILIGALASWIGAQWATASLSLAGALSMIVIYFALPRARLIR
ncbi:MAG TPA: MFS transporter [Candidatus Binatia bacterium]|nr:MFS transporter [Candidatus Binatia bacterium]